MTHDSANDALGLHRECERIFEELLNEIYIFDASSLKFLSVNRRARENTGYTADELSQLTPLDLKPEFSLKRFETLVAPLRSGSQSTVFFCVHHRRKDGSCYDAEVHLQLDTFQGRPAFIAILLDVTVRNAVAEALHIRNRAIDAASVGIVISDARQHDMPITFCNQAFERITGYSAAEAIGHNCRFLQGSDRSQPAIDLLRTAIQEQRECRATLYNYRKDGTPFWNELTISPVHNEQHVATHFIGILNDVTERVRQEEQIRQSESQLRGILNNAVEAIITIDETGLCQSLNPAAEQLFGYSQEEMLGQNISRLMPSPHQQAHDRYLSNYLETGEKKIIGIGREVTGLRKDGSKFPLHLSISEVVVGERRLFTGIIQDLTERKQYEHRLIQSERLAAVGEAMASVAHESRNLLQKIQIGVELSRQQAQENKLLLDHLGKIESASDKLHALLEEIRDYASPLKIVTNQEPLQPIVDEAWRAALQGYPRKKAQLTFALNSTETEVIVCQVDRFRLLQVFRNVFENSLAACSDPVEVTIVVSETSRGGKAGIQIVIGDNGPGLDEQQRKQIFEPFYTTKPKGTGLGMAIAKNIIQAHGGSLSVGKSGSVGAEFVIQLPSC